MPRFTRENTDGSYNTAELAELNRRYDAAIAEYGDLSEDPQGKSVEDAVAERVQSDFDAPVNEAKERTK